MTRDSLHSKVSIVRANLERLADIPQSSFEEFAADFRNLDSALHRLQTTIQALIDLASYACAGHGLDTPATSRDLLLILEAAGQLPTGSVERFGRIFGFRNRIVHLYDRIDERIGHRVLCEDRRDLHDLLDLLLASLEPARTPAEG
jgi:uncharacterized protein YutE (UPF0331/DUF86 family)